MRHTYVFALVLGTIAAGIASPQSIPPDLMNYLSLTEAQIQSINSLNVAFNKNTNAQGNQYYDLQSQAAAELAKASPDPGVVGNLYGQMVMIGRGYTTQLAQVQTNVAAVLTPAQVALVNGLLGVARLQPLVSEAQEVDLEPATVGTIIDERVGNYSSIYAVPFPGNIVPFPGNFSCCAGSSVPIALANYFNLTDAQNSAIENAILANQQYVQGQSLKIQELQYAIQALTAAQTIDTATLGADYVAIAQIQNDEATQAAQLITTVRSILMGPQIPLLTALDNALNQSTLEYEAVQNNILVLPPDLASSYSPFGYGDFLIGALY